MVNSIKLTKLEGRVLNALFEKRVAEYGNYPDEGNNVDGIAKIVYGDKVLNREKIGGPYVSNTSVCYSAMSSLSRVLTRLVKKGLVKRCTPYYHGSWEVADKERGSVGFWYRRLLNLSSSWVDEEGDWRTDTIMIGRFARLPHGTRVWWILTDRGKDVFEEITGIKQLRERCRDRCRKCECWDEERGQCKIERIGKEALSLEECREEGYWHWVEHEGWIPGKISTVSREEVAR